MSVAVNPVSRAKRLFDENDQENIERSQPAPAHKRSRHICSPTGGRCVQFAADSPLAYIVSPTTLAALLTLFPEMDERTVTSVLTECGDNIDAAIKRLTDLRLSAEDGPTGPAQQPMPQDASTANTECSGGPQTADEWLTHLVQEMASAKDMQDARIRAAGVLQLFERFLKNATKDEATKSAVKLAELQKENHILKKAVQIQNSKLQEKAQQEQELQHMRHLLAQYQEQLRTLEVNNYSLALHLQKATNSSALPGHRHPDVF